MVKGTATLALLCPAVLFLCDQLVQRSPGAEPILSRPGRSEPGRAGNRTPAGGGETVCVRHTEVRRMNASLSAHTPPDGRRFGPELRRIAPPADSPERWQGR